MRRLVSLGLFLLGVAHCPAAQAAAPPTLASGAALLGAFASSPSRFGVRVLLPGSKSIVFAQPMPLAIDVVDAHGADTWLTDGYQSARLKGADLSCAGTLQTPSGTQFHVSDTYHALPHAGAFTITRQVSITTPRASDKGFGSRFCLSPGTPTAMADDDFFVPGLWYKNNAHVPPTALACRMDDRYLRIASDGMDGVLRAWDVMRRHGHDKPQWLAFCRRYGDRLVQAQNPDGSWARAFDFSGHVVSPAKDATDQAIPFLVDLSLATGGAKCRAAALKAGEFCWTAVHQAYAYVGGTPDNPNVLDKEGGMMALAAFLSLHDISRDPRWLQAASQAAQYCETWVYCWNIPMPPSDAKVVYPRNRTTVGLSLIATGHSGADNYMAAAPFLYYRLALSTGDIHFRDTARMLLHNTKQMTDWDGTLGYRYPGLLTEVLGLPPLRGHGLTHWLPWLSAAILEPLARLQETFGSMDIDQIEALPKAQRMALNAQFARSHGFSDAHP